MSNKWNGWIKRKYFSCIIRCLSKCSQNGTPTTIAVRLRVSHNISLSIASHAILSHAISIGSRDFLMNEDIFFIIIILSFRHLMPLRQTCECTPFFNGYLKLSNILWLFWMATTKNGEEVAVVWAHDEKNNDRLVGCVQRISCSVFLATYSRMRGSHFFQNGHLFLCELFFRCESRCTRAMANTDRFALIRCFGSISYLEHLTSAPLRFNCTHCTDAALVRLGIAFKKYLDN